MGNALSRLADVLRSQGNLGEALRINREGLTIYREIGSKDGAADALYGEGTTLYIEGDLQAAIGMYQQALDLDREVGAKGDEAYGLLGIAYVLSDEGDLLPAIKMARDALAIHEAIGAKPTAGYDHRVLGDTLKYQGRLEEARGEYPRCLSLETPANEKLIAPECQHGLGLLSLEERHPEQAEAPFREELKESGGFKDDQVLARIGLAEASLAEGKSAEALEEIEANEKAATKSQNCRVRLGFAIVAARVGAASGKLADSAEARKGLEAALAEATKYGFLNYQFEARLALGEIEMKSGQIAVGRARALA